MGILGHSSHSRMPETLEGQIVRKSDQIAYINHDIDDASGAGIDRMTTFRARSPTCSARPTASASIRS